MRLLSLNLERYGPFTDTQLVFPKTAKLCVVYGENEAGKSCALAAITDLFFGIEPRTRYDFLHDAPTMRVGATIEANDGRTLTFKRRKGNKNVILDAAGTKIGDDALVPFLGGLKRDVFCNAFGLSTETLRAGGEEMMQSDGELGAALFAAASGLRGLRDLKASLDREADAIFTAHASKERRFYQAHARFEDAKRAIRETELRASDWKALNDQIATLDAALNELREKRGAKAAEIARLARIKRTAPLLCQIDLGDEQLQSLGALPEAAVGFAAKLRSQLDAVMAARREHSNSEDAVKAAERELQAVVVNTAILDMASQILDLFAGVGAYRNDRRDHPRIQGETDDFEGQLKSLAARLGMRTSEVFTAAQPSDAALALIQSLIAEFRKIAEAQDTNARLLREEQSLLANLHRQREAHGVLRDPKPLRESLATFEPVLKRLDRRAEVNQLVQSEARALKEEGSRLRPPAVDLDQLATASLPVREAISAHQAKAQSYEEALRREKERAEETRSELREISARLALLSSDGDVPTAEIIGEARSLRTSEWIRLRATLFQTKDALGGSSLVESVATFESHTARADHLSDQAASNGERIAAYAADTRQLKEAGEKLEALQAHISELEQQLQDLGPEWQSLWDGAGISAARPADMLSWLTSAAALLGRRDKLQVQRELLTSIDRDVSLIEAKLRVLGTQGGIAEAQNLPPELLVHALRGRIQALADDWESTRGVEAKIDDTSARVNKLEEAASTLAHQHKSWLESWTRATDAIGLISVTPEQAEAAILVWREVPAVLRERDNRARRVSGMARNIKQFEERAAALASSLSPGLTTRAGDAIAEELNAALVACRQAETLHVEGTRRLEGLCRLREDAARKVEVAEAACTALTADLPSETDLEVLATRLIERDDLLASLTERRTNLLSAADGIGEDDLRVDLADFQLDVVEADLQRRASEAEELDRIINQTFSEHDRGIQQRKSLESGIGAEVALQQRRNAEAELAAAARDWAVLKLGSLYMAAVVEWRRESHQDPLVGRAGQLFATLTGGSFAGLGQDFDSNDVPHLIGVRRSGDRVTTPAMSEGARDQLYLALRLAYLEDYAIRAEPAPFIGDDLFASFDEPRTARGLAALTAIGDRVQPILFTHHAYVVDVAKKEIGSDAAIIELG